MLDHFESLLGPLHSYTSSCRLDVIESSSVLSDEGGIGKALSSLEHLLVQYETKFARLDRQTLAARLSIVCHHCRKGYHAEALRLGQIFIRDIQECQTQADRVGYQSQGLYLVTCCYEVFGELEFAERCLYEAIEAQDSYFG